MGRWVGEGEGLGGRVKGGREEEMLGGKVETGRSVGEGQGGKRGRGLRGEGGSGC